MAARDLGRPRADPRSRTLGRLQLAEVSAAASRVQGRGVFGQKKGCSSSWLLKAAQAPAAWASPVSVLTMVLSKESPLEGPPG